MLSQQDLDRLLALLKESHQPFESIASNFYKTFTKSDHFKLGCVICMLLQDQLLTSNQRLVGFFLLYDMYRTEQQGTTPFVPFVLDALEQSTDQAEKKFLMQIVTSPPKDLPKQSVNEFLLSLDPTEQTSTSDMQALRNLHNAEAPQVPPSALMGIRPSIRESSAGHWAIPGMAGVASGSGSSASAAAAAGPFIDGTEELSFDPLDLRPEELTMQTLEPAWCRPVPPILEVAADEVFWLHVPQILWEPMWDFTMCADTSLGTEVRELLVKAHKSQLAPQQVNLIRQGLEQDTKLVYHCGLSPKKLPDLVEHNPVVAIEVLMKLMSSSQIHAYLEALVNMEMSLPSLEVVNRLTSAVDLPPEFIHHYLSNCISSCQGIKDKLMQNRVVRLVCVFLQSLIRNKLVKVQDLFIEVQAFCIEFGRIKEAAALFRLLKTMEGTQA